ncbi:MAG: phosphotransferase [Pseudonocardiaceae bacterium]
MGINSRFAAILRTRDQKFFCKGIPTDHPNTRIHHSESQVNRYLPDSIAPPLVSTIDAGGWLMLVFRHVEGQHADFSPHSSDLPRIAEKISTKSGELKDIPNAAADPLGPKIKKFHAWRRFSEGSVSCADLDPWARQNLKKLVAWESNAPDMVSGDTLLHADLNPGNILVSGDIYFIDWACASRGAAWVDIAYMVPRLMAWGHSAQQAEEWAQKIPAWNEATDFALTAFAVNMAGIGEYRSRQGLLKARLATMLRQWARYRLKSTSDMMAARRLSVR